MSIVLLKMTGVDGLTATVRDLVQEASTKVGEVVPMPEKIAGRLNDEMTAQTASRLLEVRRRERSVPADVLAIHLG